MKVATYERRGLWPFRRWEQTGEFDDDDRIGPFWESLEKDDPALARQLRQDSRRTFIQNWMIWGTARRGRTVQFTFDDGRVFP